MIVYVTFPEGRIVPQTIDRRLSFCSDKITSQFQVLFALSVSFYCSCRLPLPSTTNICLHTNHVFLHILGTASFTTCSLPNNTCFTHATIARVLVHTSLHNSRQFTIYEHRLEDLLQRTGALTD